MLNNKTGLLQSQQLGYDSSNLLIVNNPFAQNGSKQQQNALAQNIVERTGVVDYSFLLHKQGVGNATSLEARLSGPVGGSFIPLLADPTTPDAFDFLGINTIAGRQFSSDQVHERLGRRPLEPGSFPSHATVVITERLVQRLGLSSPQQSIGKKLVLRQSISMAEGVELTPAMVAYIDKLQAKIFTATVIGVVNDVNWNTSTAPYNLDAYFWVDEVPSFLALASFRQAG